MIAGIRKYAISLLIAGAIFAAATPVFSGEAEDKQAKLEQVRERIAALRDEIERTQTRHDSVQSELRKLERQIGERHKRLKTIAHQLGDQRRALDKLKVRQKTLRHGLQKQEKLLGRQIRAAYMIGKQEYMKLLLNQEDPAAAGRVMRYYDYFNRARSQRIAKARQTLVKLAEVQKQIQARTRKLADLQQQQRAQTEKLEQASKARSVVLAKLRSELASKNQNLEQLLEDERRLQRLVTALERAMPDILAAEGQHKPFAKLKGRLPWPTRGRLEALYGKSRQMGHLKWNGVIIQASEGKEVHAISHGRVAYADWLRGYGLLLIIDHGDGYMSLYGHNQALYKETGEWVEAGEIIASVGSSGGQAQAGLYFEIRHNGKPTNPVKWCRRST
jgi:septal ring factor EnvC (AmiA/AmiB activator)